MNSHPTLLSGIAAAWAVRVAKLHATVLVSHNSHYYKFRLSEQIVRSILCYWTSRYLHSIANLLSIYLNTNLELSHSQQQLRLIYGQTYFLGDYSILF